MAYSPTRMQRFDPLVGTWTLEQQLKVALGDRPLPTSLATLAGHTVAVQKGSVLDDILHGVPDDRRPKLRVTYDQEESIRLLASGDVTAAAGEALTQQHFARLHRLPQTGVVGVGAFPYFLTGVRGGRARTAGVVEAFTDLAAEGGVERLVERNLVRPSWWVRYRTLLVAGAGIAFAAGLASLLWISTLRQQVRSRTEALQLNEANLRRLVQNMLEGLIVMNERGSIELVNPAVERIFGYSQAELVGQSAGMLVPYPPNETELLQRLRAAIGLVTELVGRRKDGNNFPLEVTLYEFGVASNRRMAASVRDISERKAADRMKDEFVATVSHELRTPLTAITGSLQLVLADERTSTDPELVELLETGLSSSERLTRIVNDMLDLAKIEAGGLVLKRESTRVADLVRLSVASVETIARKNGVTFAVKVADDLPTLLVDADRIEQAMVNLLSNALKFAPAKSVVEVDASRDGDLVRIAISDHGPGIRSEDIGRLFGRFRQLDASPTRKTSGTGLGLVITKSLVESHGGHIEVASEFGQGSTFTIVLPAEQVSASTSS